jgi:hypothetical protein
VFFVSKYNSSPLIEAFGSPDKGWLLWGDVLVFYLFDRAAIFCHNSLQVVAERVAGPLDVGRPHPVPLPSDGPT